MKRAVFIDTSEFEAASYDFSGRALSTVRERAVDGQAVVVLPDITVREVENRIGRAVTDQLRALQSFRAKARVLRSIGVNEVRALFADLDGGEISEKLIGEFDAWRKATAQVSIPTARACIEGIVDDYFAERPPFDVSNKKAEFPDAIALSALRSWAEQEDRVILIASRDGDLQRACEGLEMLEHVGTLEALLERLAAEYDSLVSAARAEASQLDSRISKKLLRLFEYQGFAVGGYSEAEIVDVEATEADYRIRILRVRDNDERKTVVTASVSGVIRYEADLVSDDFDSATYDSEEKIYVIRHTNRFVVDGESPFEAVLRFHLGAEDPERADVQVEWLKPEEVTIEVEDHDW